MKINFSVIEDKSFVTVTNLPWGEDEDNRTSLQLNGRLEKAQDEGESHYLRCPEMGGELNGVSFTEKNIKQIEKLPSGRILIVLKF